MPANGPAGAAVSLLGSLATGGQVVSLAISPDSQRIVYVADKLVDERLEIFSVPTAGPAASGVRLNATFGTAGSDVFGSPQISPDSTRVAYIADALLDYAMSIVEETRRHPSISVGVSTRGALAWYRAAQAAALAAGREFVIPDDVKGLAVPCLAHRLVLAQAHDSLGRQRADCERVIAEIVGRVAVPT